MILKGTQKQDVNKKCWTFDAKRLNQGNTQDILLGVSETDQL